MLIKRKPKNRPKYPNRRKLKNNLHNKNREHRIYLIKLSKDLKEKGYFENCSYMPCKITYLEGFDTKPNILFTGVEGKSLITGYYCSCSTSCCAPQPLTEKEAFERRDFWLKHGEVVYQYKYVYTNATLQEIEQAHMDFLKEYQPEAHKAYVPQYQ